MPEDDAAYWDGLRERVKPHLPPSWSYRGIRGKGKAPKQLGAYEGKSLVVIGSAPCAYDDLQLIPQETDRMAVSMIGLSIGNLTHWADLHTEILPHLVHIRNVSGHFKDRPVIHAHHLQRHRNINKGMCERYIDTYWNCRPLTVGSGLFGVQIGIAMGYDKVICAGMPLDDTGTVIGRHTRERFTPDTILEQRTVWREFASFPEFKKRVRSVSGYTKELFGGI